MGRAEPGGVLAARYRLRAVLRRDDVGVVWLASDGLLHRDVAVRAIPVPPYPGDAGQESPYERALREARGAAQLDHPNIPVVFDVIEDDERAWMVLQAAPFRFPYRPLSDVVRNDGPLPPERAAQVGFQMLSALRAAHAAGILHRDVKPGHVLLGPGSRAMLTGFGMVTGDGGSAPDTPAGSPYYLAPERAIGLLATPAADLWSLGATLYAAVEGRSPFDRDDRAAVLGAVVRGCPDPPHRAGALWPVISGLLRKDASARPDAAGVAWLLLRVGGARDVAGPVPPAGSAVPPARSAVPSAGPPVPPARSPVPPARSPVPPAGSAVPPAGSAVPSAGSVVPPAGATPAPGTPLTADQDDAAPAMTATAQPAAPAGTATAQPAAPAATAAEAATGPDFIPGFGPRDAAPAGDPPEHGDPPADEPVQDGPKRWRWFFAAVGGTATIAAAAAIMAATLGGSPKAPGGHLAAAGSGAVASGRQSAPDHRKTSLAPDVSQARHGLEPGPATRGPPHTAPPVPGRSGPQALPAGFSWYHDPTGFSIAVPGGWRVSHQGHLVYVRDPHGGRFLIVDQTTHPKPSALADWRSQEAARIGSYPGYHRIRLTAVRYAPARQAADWEFTYYDNGQLTHVLNRNILVSAQHAYALYWSVPASEWHASFRYFRAFAATFRPATTIKPG
jgi:eukaryotic-like serine/threonine-protein kinase